MKRLRSFMLMAAMIFGLAIQAAAPAALPLMSPALSQPCHAACAEMPGDCDRQCLPCPTAAACRTNGGCGMPVVVGPAGNANTSELRLAAAYARLVNAALPGRSVKPEQHPPNS